MSFHLSRETGKIIRIVSRGSVSFANILRYIFFFIGPVFLEVGLVLGIMGIFFPYWFFLMTLFFVVSYMVATWVITEWRTKHFKAMNDKDNAYN